MKKKVLITRVSGVGKTTTGKYFRKMGYESTDIEYLDGMFQMVHKDTKKVFKGYTNANPEHIKNADWICNVAKLKNFLASQKSDLAFYSGIASNMDDILPLFDKVIVLQPNAKNLNDRLKNREGTDDIGNNQEGRDTVLGWKDWWENKMEQRGATIINADGRPRKICRKILNDSQIRSWNKEFRI